MFILEQAVVDVHSNYAITIFVEYEVELLCSFYGAGVSFAAIESIRDSHSVGKLVREQTYQECKVRENFSCRLAIN